MATKTARFYEAERHFTGYAGRVIGHRPEVSIEVSWVPGSAASTRDSLQRACLEVMEQISDHEGGDTDVP